ncbi:MAG: zinc-ribbon domain-containing protein [Natronincolaceae bacterium]
MKCSNCGESLPDKSKYCLSCGAAIDIKDREINNDKKAGVRTKNIIYMLVSILIILSGIPVYFYHKQPKGNQSKVEMRSMPYKGEDIAGVGMDSYYALKYNGETIEGEPYGKGKIFYTIMSGSIDGIYYEGEFKNGKIHGYGVLNLRYGDKYYEGKFEDGKITGEGKYYLSGVVKRWFRNLSEFYHAASYEGNDDSITLIIYELSAEAEESLEGMLDTLGFSSAVANRMYGTRAIDGTQEAEGKYANATWTYHPNSGLRIVFESYY